ncbi:hypothetical protein ACTFIZ_007620 [Dictyostelium cf. discoideum]
MNIPLVSTQGPHINNFRLISYYDLLEIGFDKVMEYCDNFNIGKEIHGFANGIDRGTYQKNYFSCKGKGNKEKGKRCGGCETMVKSMNEFVKKFQHGGCVVKEDIKQRFLKSYNEIFYSQYPMVCFINLLLDHGIGSIRFSKVTKDLAESLYFHGGRSVIDIIRGCAIDSNGGEIKVDPVKANMFIPSRSSIIERTSVANVYPCLEDLNVYNNILFDKFPKDKNGRAKAILVFDETELIYSLQVHNGVLIGFTEQVDSSNIDPYVEKVKNIVELNPNTYPALLKKMMANKFLMIFVVSICGTYSFPLIHKPTFKETSNSVKELVTSIINHFNQNYNVDIVGGSSDGFDTSLLLNTIPEYYHCYDMVHSGKNCRNHFNLGNFSIVHTDKSLIKFSGSSLQDYYQISPEFKKIISYDALFPFDQMSLQSVQDLLTQDVLNHLINQSIKLAERNANASRSNTSLDIPTPLITHSSNNDSVNIERKRTFPSIQKKVQMLPIGTMIQILYMIHDGNINEMCDKRYKRNKPIEKIPLFQAALYIMSIKLLFQIFLGQYEIGKRMHMFKLLVYYHLSFEDCGSASLIFKQINITRESILKINEINREQFENGVDLFKISYLGTDLAENFFSQMRSKNSKMTLLTAVVTLNKAIIELIKKHKYTSSSTNPSLNYKQKEFKGPCKYYANLENSFTDYQELLLRETNKKKKLL